MKKLYRLFNLEDVMESPLYYPNLHAITGEDLHSKMEIAAELTHRDMLIEALLGQLGDTRKELSALEASHTPDISLDGM